MKIDNNTEFETAAAEEKKKEREKEKGGRMLMIPCLAFMSSADNLQ